MPTGYTAPVKDGAITEFVDYALMCSRAFGALVLLRDSDQSLEATRRFIDQEAYAEPSGYYPEALAAARERLEQLRGMSDAEALEAASTARAEAEEREREREEKRLAELARYEAMVEKVESWTPPSEEHVGFKEFMLEQLRSSIDFDCSPFVLPLPEVSPAWRDEQIASTEEIIERCTTQMEEERERNAGRRKWVEDLVASLEAVPA